jgi:hypothetical protein
MRKKRRVRQPSRKVFRCGVGFSAVGVEVNGDFGDFGLIER